MSSQENTMTKEANKEEAFITSSQGKFMDGKMSEEEVLNTSPHCNYSHQLLSQF